MVFRTFTGECRHSPTSDIPGNISNKTSALYSLSFAFIENRVRLPYQILLFLHKTVITIVEGFYCEIIEDYAHENTNIIIKYLSYILQRR